MALTDVMLICLYWVVLMILIVKCHTEEEVAMEEVTAAEDTATIGAALAVQSR